VHLSLISLRLKELCKHGGLYHNAPVKATLSDDGDRLDVSLWDGDRSSPATMHGVNCASSIPPPHPGFVGVSLLADPVEGVLAYVRERRARKSTPASTRRGLRARAAALAQKPVLLLPSFLGSLAHISCCCSQCSWLARERPHLLGIASDEAPE
jgi:hypothetical protein